MYKNSDEFFIEIIKNSSSIRQCLVSLGLKPAGGSYRIFHDRVKRLNLDTSHFKGQAWNKGQNLKSKVPLENYLSNEKPIQSFRLKNKLLKNQVFNRQCFSCSGVTWMNHPIPLELDHIDGNHKNNVISNLRLLCPNCHALTETYRGKNKNKS